MQIKYLSALKTKYASFWLSKEAFDRVASQRVKTIENESEIDSDVASSETAMLIMKEMQGATDALRNNNARIQKELDSLKTNVPTQITQSQTTPTPDNAIAEELKQIKEMFAGMKASMDADKKKARTETILAQAHKVMEQNGCINEFIRKITLNGVEVGEADTAESIAEKYKSVYDQICKDAFGDGYVPPRSNSKSGGETDQAEVTRILQSRGLLPKESN